jgi:hypothetical protein
MVGRFERQEEHARPGGDAAQRTERWRNWLRGSVSAASLLLLLASLALFAAEHHADGRRAGLRWTALAAGSTQQLADLTFFERFMQRLATLNSNSTGAANATDCPEGEECIPAEAVRASALQIANNLAGDWLVRTSAKDQHPYQFCAEYPDLSATEMRACVKHLMRPLELAREEAISHNSTNASFQLALQNNATFNVSDEHGWDACYDAWEDQEDKETCVTFVSNRLEGDVALACSNLDSPEELLKCGRVKQAVDNIIGLILRQKVMPVSGALNGKIMQEPDREQAIREMQESENKTEEALQAMSPELQKMLAKTIEISAESNNKLTAMEQAINDTLLSGPQSVVDRLGPNPGPFGELPGKVEHEYMVNKTLAANRSAVAEEVAAAAANSSVEATKIVMRAIISRKYNGAGDAARALRLMNSSSSASANTAAEEVKGNGEQTVLDGTSTQLGAAAHTSTLLQVGGGMQGGRSIAARVQGLVQLEKLAEHGNLGDLDSIMDHNVQWQHAGLTPEEKADAKVAIAFGDDGFNMHRHRESDSGLQMGSGLNSALDGFSHLLLSHKGPALHVAPSSEFKSAADIASQFNADSVSTLLNLANDGAGSEASDNDDLTSVMEGTVPAPHVPPPRALVDKALIAKEFKDDDMGKVASSGAEQQGQGTGWMQRFYKNIKAEGNANRHVGFSWEATAVTAPRSRVAGAMDAYVSPRAVAQVKEVRRRGDMQHAPATATKRAIPFNPYGYTHAQEDPVAKDPVAKEGETSIKSLWSNLLKEEAIATAAKHQAHVAKKQATLAALKIKEQETAKAKEAVQQEEAKLRRDELKVLEDRQKAKSAKKQADLLAHKLAEDKFAEMQEKKGAAKALEARKAAAKKLEQQSASQRGEFQKAKAAMMEQARKDAARAQQHQPHHVRVQTATQQPARRETSAHVASPAVKQLQTSTPSKNPVLSRGTSRTEASHGTGSDGGEEAAIVETVKRLEDKAEREPVVTRRERQEQRAEVKEAKKLLQQAAWLPEHAAYAAANRAPASEEPTVTPVHRIRSKQQPTRVRDVKRQEHDDVQPALIHDAAVAEDAPSQHGRIWDGVTWGGVVASPSQAAQGVVQHRQEALPAQVVAPSAPAASAPATATSVVQRSVVQGLKVQQGIARQREKSREQDAEPPVAQQLPPSVDGSNLGDLLNLMNTPLQSASSIKPHDGLGDSLSGLGDDRKIQKLRNDDMSAAGLIAAAPVQAEKRIAVAGVAAAPPLVPAPAPSKPSALSPTQIMEAKIRKENDAEEAEEARVKGLVNSLTAGDDIDDDDDELIKPYQLGSHLHSAQVLPLLLFPPACLCSVVGRNSGPIR